MSSADVAVFVGGVGGGIVCFSEGGDVVLFAFVGVVAEFGDEVDGSRFAVVGVGCDVAGWCLSADGCDVFYGSDSVVGVADCFGYAEWDVGELVVFVFVAYEGGGAVADGVFFGVVAASAACFCFDVVVGLWVFVYYGALCGYVVGWDSGDAGEVLVVVRCFVGVFGLPVDDADGLGTDRFGV